MAARTLVPRPVPGRRPAPAALLEQAEQASYRWPADFPGFAATVLVHTEQATHVGAFAARGPAALSLRLHAPAALETWANALLGTLIADRWHRPATAAGSGCTADEPDHPLGIRLSTTGGSRSQYRVRDGRVCETVRRSADGVTRVAVLAGATARDGRQLPTVTVASYSDPATGALKAIQTTEMCWQLVGDVHLPAQCRVVRQDAAGLSTREIEFADHVAWR